MQPTLSVEEFQRFQSQLLDLRESQIEANDARLRAEARAKQLETQVAELRSALAATQRSTTHQARIDQLTKDNEQLRMKLLSTESAFQLQSSTLRAECLHLSAEVDRLQRLMLPKSTLDQTAQTESLTPVVEVQVQTELVSLSPPSSPCSPPPPKPEEIFALESRLSSLTTLVHTELEVKLNELELRCQQEFSAVLTQIEQHRATECALANELDLARQTAQKALESEQEAREQLAAVKSRSEKLNRELRRQLSRLLRPDAERASLRKLSIYSSSSSLSSATANATNGEGCAAAARQQTHETVDGPSSTGQIDIPAGFFPMSDVKTLVDRLSEVQEENCSLRRQVQRLDCELAAKTRALQVEVSNRLESVDSAASASLTTSDRTGPEAGHSEGDIGTRQSRASNGLFTPLSSMLSHVLKPIHTDPTTLSSANLETVNRLKRMCENLLTENMRLSAQLEAAAQGSLCDTTS